MANPDAVREIFDQIDSLLDAIARLLTDEDDAKLRSLRDSSRTSLEDPPSGGPDEMVLRLFEELEKRGLQEVSPEELLEALYLHVGVLRRLIEADDGPSGGGRVQTVLGSDSGRFRDPRGRLGLAGERKAGSESNPPTA